MPGACIHCDQVRQRSLCGSHASHDEFVTFRPCCRTARKVHETVPGVGRRAVQFRALKQDEDLLGLKAARQLEISGVVGAIEFEKTTEVDVRVSVSRSTHALSCLFILVKSQLVWESNRASSRNWSTVN